MKKLALLASAASFALLAACGDSTDASEEAEADTVEMPADEAMADVPAPVADPNAMTDEEAEEVIGEGEADAEEAAVEAQSAVDDAIAAAEAEME